MSDTVEADFIIPPDLGEMRLDQALSELMPEHSRSRIQNWIKAEKVLVNGKPYRPRDKVVTDDCVSVQAEVELDERWEPQDIPLDIVFEDEHLLVINKPAGLVVHPAAGHGDGTLVNAVLHHYAGAAALPRAGIVHRLDKDTTGLMVVAKSLIAHTSLVDQLQTRSMGREYEAIVTGVMTGGGMVDEPIARHPQQRTKMAVHPLGKEAITHFRVLQRFVAHTWVRLKLETGRTHQIRVHMAHIHYPLVGDPVYGGRMRIPKGVSAEVKACIAQFGRQALHARELQLYHPVTDELMTWESDLPEDMQHLLEIMQPNEQD
jgi:23S rRNA pseudouridine1911/1915/1917 synthase